MPRGWHGMVNAGLTLVLVGATPGVYFSVKNEWE
jgi:hypothetical protein